MFSDVKEIIKKKSLNIYDHTYDLKENPEHYRGYTKKALAAKFELSEADLEGVATGEGDMINIDSIIADPNKKKNVVTDGSDLG